SDEVGRGGRPRCQPRYTSRLAYHKQHSSATTASEPSHLPIPIRGSTEPGFEVNLRLPRRIAGQCVASARPGRGEVLVALIGRQQGGAPRQICKSADGPEHTA